MRPLSPNINWIERQLFSPTERLLERLAANDPDLPQALRDAAESDPEAMKALKELREFEKPSTASAAEPPPMPEALRELAARRDAAREAGSTRSPKPAQGQVVRIDRVIGPNGEIPWDLGRPLAVLLDAPTESTPKVWRGWVVASETDYATDWDLLLEAEEDEPFDPLAGMVQVWNPVEVYIPSTSAVLAELKPARMAAVRALADEWLLAEDRPASEARPGRVFPRLTLGGLRVLTGTTLSGPGDPRWRYQELYHAVTGAITEPARLALKAAAFAGSRQWLSDRLADWSEMLGRGPWVLAGAKATLGAEQDRQPGLPEVELPGLLRLKFFPEANVVHVRLERLSDAAVTVKKVADGEIASTCNLDADLFSDDMFLSADDDWLRVFDSRGEQVAELPVGALSEDDAP